VSAALVYVALAICCNVSRRRIGQLSRVLVRKL
jgi:hypothetical protein